MLSNVKDHLPVTFEYTPAARLFQVEFLRFAVLSDQNYIRLGLGVESFLTSVYNYSVVDFWNTVHHKCVVFMGSARLTCLNIQLCNICRLLLCS
jgi:hypothetical protein